MIIKFPILNIIPLAHFNKMTFEKHPNYNKYMANMAIIHVKI